MRDINPNNYPGAPAPRSIRAIPVSARHHSAPPYYEQPRRRGGWGRVLLLLGTAVILVGVGALLLSFIFAGATVSVHPRQLTVDAPAMLEARLNAPVGMLEYTEISHTREASVSVDAAGTQQVSRQASGSITVSNNYSAEPQRLIANTRFEAQDGKIYRIRESVTVPGMSGGKAGSVVATVYADSPGASYNKPTPTSFTIPGFKGDPKYEKITGESQGAITGGFVGSEPAVAPQDLAEAKESLRRTLDEEVRAAIMDEIPEGSGFLPGSLNLTYQEVTQTSTQGSKATLTQSVTARAAMVGGSDLGAAIARAKLSDYQGEAVALTPVDLEVSASSTATGVLALSMKGTVQLTWQFDPNAVREALLGKQKSEFQKILASFKPAIECTAASPCDARIKPFWTTTFPTDPAKIKVISKGGE